MKIYTGTGDKGQTSLPKGGRVAKDDPFIEFLGTVDELNAVLGTIDLPQIDKIQKELIAFMGGKTDQDIGWLEKEIDRMEEKLPELHGFILPKGQVHFARAVCRRAERRAVAVGWPVKYLNRLSDYLFVLARYEKSCHQPS